MTSDADLTTIGSVPASQLGAAECKDYPTNDRLSLTTVMAVTGKHIHVDLLQGNLHFGFEIGRVLVRQEDD